jgi:hypothetical protein
VSVLIEVQLQGDTMTDYTILPIAEEHKPKNMLLAILANMPTDIDAVSITADLFKRYEKKGIAHRFSMRKFINPSRDPHGVMVGLTGTIVIFWRSSEGHFWIDLNDISFEHPAAFLTGSFSPIIDKPYLGICYRFSKGGTRVLAKQFSASDSLRDYQEVIKINPLTAHAATPEEDAGSLSYNFRPVDSANILGR